jgi:putative oxidoreductase
MLELIVGLRRDAIALLGRLAFLPPLVARFVVGYVFVRTGWGKLHNLDGVIEYFTSLGIPYAELQAPFVASVEFGCGLLVLFGLAARLAAIPLIGTMVVAIATALWADIEGLGGLFGTSEFLYIVLFGWIAVAGPGAASLDALLVRLLERRVEPVHRHAHGHAHGTLQA